MSAAPYRAVALGAPARVRIERRGDGSTWIEPDEPLQPYPVRLCDRLLHWARVAPRRTLVARRRAAGGGCGDDWHCVSYAEACAGAQRIAQGLIDRELSEERPVAVLSGNDIEHFLLMLGCLLAGVPVVPIGPAYSLQSHDHRRLRRLLALVTPGLVYASDGARYGRAIRAAVAADCEVVLARGAVDGRTATGFDGLLATPVTAAVERRHAAVGPDTIAKLLFTSGSTSLPKAVINTHRMLASNQQTILQSFAVLGQSPPVLVDWLPWNHTFGGNHNTGIVIYNGGTLYIDDGNPTAAGIGETLRNLREIAPTAYFNVPEGFAQIARAAEGDAPLRAKLYSRVGFFFYAAAGLPQATWERLDAVALQACGERIRMLTGLGMTETAPFALCARDGAVRSGHVGLPGAGCTVKLVDAGAKLEVRYRGPMVTPGYWRNPQQTAAAFDEDGFLRSRDAVRFVDPADPQRGLQFDGRLDEDFKLSSGTLVSAGPLCARIVAAGAPYVQHAVLTGADRAALGVLVFPSLDDCRALARLSRAAPASEVFEAAPVHAVFQQLVDQLWASGSRSASRIARLGLLQEPPSVDHGELTVKGTINQGAVLARRAALIDALYADDRGVPPHFVACGAGA